MCTCSCISLQTEKKNKNKNFTYPRNTSFQDLINKVGSFIDHNKNSPNVGKFTYHNNPNHRGQNHFFERGLFHHFLADFNIRSLAGNGSWTPIFQNICFFFRSNWAMINWIVSNIKEPDNGPNNSETIKWSKDISNPDFYNHKLQPWFFQP